MHMYVCLGKRACTDASFWAIKETRRCWIPWRWSYRHLQEAWLVTWYWDLVIALQTLLTSDPSFYPPNIKSLALRSVG